MISQKRFRHAEAGIRQAARGMQGAGQIAPERRVLRGQRDSAGQDIGRILGQALLPQEQAEVPQRTGKVAIALEQGAKTRLRLAPIGRRRLDFRYIRQFDRHGVPRSSQLPASENRNLFSR